MLHRELLRNLLLDITKRNAGLLYFRHIAPLQLTNNVVNSIQDNLELSRVYKQITPDINVCGKMLSSVNNVSFSDWLNDQLKSQNMSQADLARKSGVSRGMISHLINGTRLPGPEALIAIAEALKLPPEFVFRKAGLLPEEGTPRQIAQQVAGYKLSELTPTQLDEVIQFIEFIQNRDDRPDRRTSYKTSREGTPPPETIKDKNRT